MKADDESLPAWTKAPVDEVRKNGFTIASVELREPAFLIHAYTAGKMRCFEYTLVDGAVKNTTAPGKAVQKAFLAARRQQPS